MNHSSSLLNSNNLLEQEVMQQIYYNAPYAPFSSNNKKCGVQSPRRKAFLNKYVQLNPPCNLKWLIIDVDDDVNVIDFNALRVPEPNAIVKNKTNNRGHLLYRVDDVLVKSINSSVAVKNQPIQYAKAVYYGLCNAIPGADRSAFNNVVTKNPFHDDYLLEVLHAKKFTLKDIGYAITPDWSVYKTGNKVNTNPDSRHLSLFHTVRHDAYRNVERFRLDNDIEGFYRYVKGQCDIANQYQGKGFKEDGDLAESSTKAIAKSIAEWTFNNYNAKGNVNRGVMKLPHDMGLKEKQSHSAERTAQNRRNKTLNALIIALKAMPHQDSYSPATLKKQLAEKAKISLSTVRRYWDLLQSKKDSLGVHKVSFPRSKAVSTTSFKYSLSGFKLSNVKSLLPSEFKINKESVSLTSHYFKNSDSTRLSERADLNVQLLNPALRKKVFQGWYEIDLVFSHGQLLAEYLKRKENDIGLWSVRSNVISLLAPIQGYLYFIDNMDLCFANWSQLFSQPTKVIKNALIALMNGCSERTFKEKLGLMSDYSFSDLAFVEVYQAIKLVREYEPGIMKIIKQMEVALFEPFWGKGLLIHDSLLTLDFSVASELSELPFQWSIEKY